MFVNEEGYAYAFCLRTYRIVYHPQLEIYICNSSCGRKSMN